MPRTSPTSHASASPSSSRDTRSSGPRLSISITDGQTAVKPGDTLTYLVHVQDSGTYGASHLMITQTLPAGLKFLSASGHGAVTAGQVAWLTGIPAGGADTFRVVTQVTRPPAAQLRLAAVACATTQGSRVPIVCAAHLDRLPAAVAPTAKASGSSGPTALAYGGMALAVLVLCALGVIVGRITSRRRAASHRTT